MPVAFLIMALLIVGTGGLALASHYRREYRYWKMRQARFERQLRDLRARQQSDEP